MIKFCRSCGKPLANAEARECSTCGASAIKSTSYCRYCGHPTKPEDATCSHCGASIKPLPSTVKSIWEHPRLSVKMGKIVNLSLVVLGVTAYIIFTLPKSVTKPIQAKAADVVYETTGYTALPLVGLSAWPTKIPMVNDAPGNTQYFRVGQTTQLYAYAIYKNTDPTSKNVTKAARVEEVTSNCTFMSISPSVANVTPEGLVTAVADGRTTIVVSYTAVPGSSNTSSQALSQGRIPITVTFNVSVKIPI